MQKLIVTCGAIALVAALMPGALEGLLTGGSGSSSLSTARVVAPLPGAAGGAPALSAPRETRVSADRQGHFIVDAEVGGATVRMMVDTGASVVALTRSDAERAGLRPHPHDFTVPVSTANGVAKGAAATLDRVAVGGIEVEGVPAIVLEDGLLSISLLGTSFLSRLDRVEIAEDELVLED